MSSPRTYSLPRNSYSGTVAGVRIAYNAATIASLEGIENDGLKRAMEDMAVHAALERGFTSVSIRSMPHSWTINRAGNRVNDALHMTITAGAHAVPGHVYCSGVNPELDPSHWYDQLRSDHIKWDDRATSSNASTPRAVSSGGNSPYTGGGQARQSNGSYSQPSGSEAASSAAPRWVPTGSSIPGRRYQWWNGRAYTNDYC